MNGFQVIRIKGLVTLCILILSTIAWMRDHPTCRRKATNMMSAAPRMVINSPLSIRSLGSLVAALIEISLQARRSFT